VDVIFSEDSVDKERSQNRTLWNTVSLSETKCCTICI